MKKVKLSLTDLRNNMVAIIGLGIFFLFFASVMIYLLIILSVTISKSKNQDLISGLPEQRSAKNTSSSVGLLMMTNNSLSTYCGCTLITQNVILTAAHCFDGFRPSDVAVTFESSDPDISKINAVLVKSWKKHEKYDANNLQYDIAIAELDRKVQLQPICLHESNKYNYKNAGDKKRGEALGWMHCSNNSINNQALVKVVTITKCDSDSDIHDSSKICALGKQGPCRGDSGGPLLQEGRQVGVISGGYNSGNGSIDVYPKVDITWIANNLDYKARKQFLTTQACCSSKSNYVNVYIFQFVIHRQLICNNF